MIDEYIGCLVSVDCGETLGIYQGRVKGVCLDQQTIVLENPIRNGKVFGVKSVTLNAPDIEDLNVLKLANEFDSSRTEMVPVPRPRSTDSPGRLRYSKSFSASNNECNGYEQRSNGYGDSRRHNSGQYTNGVSHFGHTRRSHTPDPPHEQNNGAANYRNQRPHQNGRIKFEGDSDMKRLFGKAFANNNSWKRESNGHSQSHANNQLNRQHNQSEPNFNARHNANGPRRVMDRFVPKKECLHEDIDKVVFDTDFDFEANNMMFNKQELYKELGDPLAGARKNYRHDENIVEDSSRVYQAAKRVNKWVTYDTHALVPLLCDEEVMTCIEDIHTLDNCQMHSTAMNLARCMYECIAQMDILQTQTSILVLSAGDSASVTSAVYLANILCHRGVSTAICLPPSSANCRQMPPVDAAVRELAGLDPPVGGFAQTYSLCAMVALSDPMPTLPPLTPEFIKQTPLFFAGIGGYYFNNFAEFAAKAVLSVGLPMETMRCLAEHVYMAEVGCQLAQNGASGAAYNHKMKTACETVFRKSFLVRVKML